MVGKYNRVLAECSLVHGNQTEIALEIIKRANPSVKNAFADVGKYVFNIKFSDFGYVFLVLCSKDVDLQVQNGFLDSIEQQWNQIIHYNDEIPQAYSQNAVFSPFLRKELDYYNKNFNKIRRSYGPVLDRQMTNLHFSKVSNKELSIISLPNPRNMTRNQMIICILLILLILYMIFKLIFKY